MGLKVFEGRWLSDDSTRQMPQDLCHRCGTCMATLRGGKLPEAGGIMHTYSGAVLHSLLLVGDVLCQEGGDGPSCCPADRGCPHEPLLPLRHGPRPGIVRGFALGLVVLRACCCVLQGCMGECLEHCSSRTSFL